jgi:hypothetical protein
MARSSIVLGLAAAAVLLIRPALAAEGATELTTGGLIFARHDDLEMVAQELAISAAEITVRYRLQNKSERNLSVLVGFPMPEVHIESSDDAPSLPSEDSANLLGFTAAVNGTPVTAAVEQRAIVGGLDRTQLLLGLGIPLAPHLSGTQAMLDRLPADKAEELQRLGIIELERDNAGRVSSVHFSPRWALQTTFFWEQLFPANNESLVELRYKPSVGGTRQTLLGSPGQAKESWFDEYKDKYCLTYEFLAAVERARKLANSALGAPFSEQRIDYAHRMWINTTATPLHEFRLMVEKAGADNLVSFCGEEAAKMSDTQLELSNPDYTPDGTLSILILSKQPQR